jgi:hypothetical protein
MAVLYFGAVGIAFLHDRSKARRNRESDIGDDNVSPIEPVEPADVSDTL